MIIVKEIQKYEDELKEILEQATLDLRERFNPQNKNLLRLSGAAFEKEVCDTLNKVSTKSHFKDKFEQASAHAFPDIYAKILENDWFGVEIKTSQNDWKCFGNSIFESTRIKNLDDRIYVFFGKITNSLECRWAKYDECIDNINITHSPRYQINMEIKENPELSVFHKMDTTYLDFHKSDISKRMEYVRKFKRASVGQDIALWWLPNQDNPTKEDEEKLLIKVLKDVDGTTKKEILYKALVLFPEIFSKNNKIKFSRYLVWLASEYGVITGNARDLFTAGGRLSVEFKNNSFKTPKICKHIVEGASQIKQIIKDCEDEVGLKWGIINKSIPNSYEERLNFWIEEVQLRLNEMDKSLTNYPLKEWLTSLFQ